MVKQVTAWQDNIGVLHETSTGASKADASREVARHLTDYHGRTDDGLLSYLAVDPDRCRAMITYLELCLLELERATNGQKSN